MLTIVGNRHQAGHRDVVSSMSQLALPAVDVSGGPGLDDLVERTWRAATRRRRRSAI